MSRSIQRLDVILMAYRVQEVLNFEEWLSEQMAHDPESAPAQDGKVERPLGNSPGGSD